MDTPPTARYEQLASHIERQLQLVGEGRWNELAELTALCDELMESLPAAPADAARPMLERCALLNRRVRIELLRTQDDVLVSLAQVERGLQAAMGYAPPRVRASSVSTSA